MRNKIVGVLSPVVFIWSETAFAETAIETPSYGWLLFKTLFVLTGICILAYVGLRYLSKVSIGKPGPMQILGRLPIEGRRSVLVIDVAGKTLIIGNSEAGMHTLGELNRDERNQFVETNNTSSFQERLRNAETPTPEESLELVKEGDIII